jgi:tRNA threonylcarbamoyladenosine biosynthesis protein TsaB
VRVLGLDTTTSRGSVAIVEDDELRGEVRLVCADGHSRWILSAIELLLHHLGLGPQDLDGLAVSTGPGSFTGLRVGLSSIQGLALGTGSPCLGLPALDVLAAQGAEFGPRVVTLMDASRDEVYAGLYEEGHRIGVPRVGALEDALAGLFGPLVVVGNGLARYRERIAAALPQARLIDIDLFLGAPLARLALPILAAGGGGGPESIRPLYLRGADIRKAP